MAYRPSEKTKAHKAKLRSQIIDSALLLISEGGFGALTIAAVAQRAGIATGAIYKHFDSKAQLCAEVFQLATEKEVAVVKQAALGEGSPSSRLLNAIEAFAKRAVHARRLAYALIAEPVDSLVDVERLRYRKMYAEIFQDLVEEGMRTGDFPNQPASVSAAALVGAIAEALIGPLAWPPSDSSISNITDAQLIQTLQSFCLRAVALQDL